MGYTIPLHVRQTPIFRNWLARLPDRIARIRLLRRIERLGTGNPGDQRQIAPALYELREHFGPGYRIYVTYRPGCVVLLLGGSKQTQGADIARAKAMLTHLEIDE